MSNIDYIINLCFDISERGKTPSVALIRNMAKQPLSIPEVIKGLQQWKSTPNNRPKAESSHKPINSAPNQSLQQRVTQLEEQVASIMLELAKISKEKTK